MLKLREGAAVFERDSVLFDKPQYPWPAIACLLRVALESDERLSVLDFGGALGSTYFNCRSHFATLKELRWCVVEQPAHVACGLSEFSNEQLVFYPDIAACRASEDPGVFFCSSALQYMENPWQLLELVCQKPFRFLLLDRTTVFMDSLPDRLTVQTVPPSIYDATYPCWMLNYERLKLRLEEAYEILFEFPAHSDVEIPLERTRAVYAGLFARKKG